ncbi:hypothetical protein [Mucilaginibacter segetis]|uniref:Lipoprotein n=1 Tax=Mucilaginibacter segetis TaxID=2793071 RepID=A0A934PPF3_9SPHI|nr:hypothetical protein [Mucilaginibacter segetis]MBK0378289.1 hypothetical protein [Mucilaginibacter segetis]
MKKNLIYLFPILIAFGMGCTKSSNSSLKPLPEGTFNGEFRLLHRSQGSTVIDTVKANIQLVLETGVGYKVLGDTSTVHAGSKGHYGISDIYIAFQDDTYPTTGTPTKTHLSGTYQYYYDGSSVFQMVANSSDTLSLQYDLKKVN